jgi:hypothetical protein
MERVAVHRSAPSVALSESNRGGGGMDATGFHRELLLPSPTKEPPEIPPIVWTSGNPFWLEIHREEAGRVRYSIGSASYTDLESMVVYLENTCPRLAAGPSVECALAERVYRGILARAVPLQKHNHLPIRLRPESDAAGFLLRTLSSRTLHDHDVVLQLLFRRVRVWESSFFSPLYDDFARRQNRGLRIEMDARRGEPAYHVELRTRLSGPQPKEALSALGAWLEQWTNSGGVPWRSWEQIPTKAEADFHWACVNHDIGRFSTKKARRDVSSTELAHLLSIPWAAHHPECSYAGAPALPPPRELAAAPGTDASRTGIVVGQTNGTNVRLPSDWHHLAILGKTRSGKSTLAQNVALQILANEPDARVIVLEPTGNLIQDLVERLPNEVANDTVEIDPSHPTFERDGVEMATVPVNLLHLSGRRDVNASELERRIERLLGDLLQAIRNAWGEESIGGRAEFILRAVVQGLLTIDGTNLVDAYSAFSDKEVLRRLERVCQGAPLKKALGQHLSKLGYDFTFSSLDKVGKIATNPLLRKALCQRFDTVGFEELLEHRLLLLNLAKGALGTEASTFLGAIFLTRLWSALQGCARPDRPLYLVVDEFHNFAIPAFADMLSEGARLGLHVVAITQYLNRIPEKVRSALVGNVDVWAFFPVGAEDTKDVWEIAQGSRFGWKPEHFAGGLAPFQVALATRDALTKLDTRPVPPPSPQPEVKLEAVRSSSRRYARPEDSEVSPLDRTQKDVLDMLRSILEIEGKRWTQWQSDHLWSDAEVSATVALCEAMGDVVRQGKGVTLTPRGAFHLEALEAARNEGPSHTDILTDGATPLRGLRPRVADQGPLLARPDAEFEWNGQTYNLEVETSNLTKHPEQVVQNLRKALAGQRPCLFAVQDRESAEQLLRILTRAVPEALLWREYGIVWQEEREKFHPLESGPYQPWDFLTGAVQQNGGDHSQAPTLQLPGSIADSDLAKVHSRAKQLLAEDKSEVALEDFRGVFGPQCNGALERQRLGMALVALGVPSRRVRREDRQERVYDIRSLADPNDRARETSTGKPEEGREESDTSADSAGKRRYDSPAAG